MTRLPLPKPEPSSTLGTKDPIESATRSHVFPATAHQIPALLPTAAGELSCSDP